MSKEEKKSQAYQDCFDRLDPSMPYDPEYMQAYSFWRQIARYDEDTIELRDQSWMTEGGEYMNCFG